MKKPSIWKALLTKPMLITLLMGFSSGMPLLLTLKTLQAWMTGAGVDLKTIGFFSLAGIPYTLKFLWAPIMDRFTPLRLGRRRGWLLLSQIGLVLSITAMAITNPKVETGLMAFWAFIVSFFSASQDIVVDAYRRESLADEDLGLGSAFYIYGYRIAMWVSGGLTLILAPKFISWTMVYCLMAFIVGLGILTTLWADEPKIEGSTPKTLKAAVIEPFMEFMKRYGAFVILAFILFYKLGDVMAGNMLTPYYIKMGYSTFEIGIIAKTFSLPVTILGAFIGGALVHNWGVVRCLWVFGFLQMSATFGFNLLLIANHSLLPLGAVIVAEDLATSMATSAYVAFMASMTNKRFTGTQYALLTSLMGIPRVILSSPTGIMVEHLGWFWFFTFCTLIAIPGMLLIPMLQRMIYHQK